MNYNFKEKLIIADIFNIIIYVSSIRVHVHYYEENVLYFIHFVLRIYKVVSDSCQGKRLSKNE